MAAVERRASLFGRAYQHWALGAAVFGIIMCMAAGALGILSVTFHGRFDAPGLRDLVIKVTEPKGKEVGYLWALNWSVYSTFVLPVIIWCGLQVWFDVPAAIDSLAEGRMVRDATFAPVRRAELLRHWKRHRRSFLPIFIAFAALGAIFVMGDWWMSVVRPLLSPSHLRGREFASLPFEFDWSVSALYQGSSVSTFALIVFTFVGYVFVPLISALLVLETYACVFAFMTFLGSWKARERTWRLVADPRIEEDDKCGWHIFGTFYSNLLIFSLVVLMGFWLMIVQNAYLLDPTKPDVVTFVAGATKDLWDKIYNGTAIKNLPETVKDWLFEPTVSVFSRPKGGIGTLLFGMICYISVVSSWWILRTIASQSRQTALSHVRELAEETRISQHEIKRRLKAMRFWPVAWIRENALIALMTLFFFSLFSYRIILPVMIFAVLIALQALIMSAVKFASASRE